MPSRNKLRGRMETAESDNRSPHLGSLSRRSTETTDSLYVIQIRTSEGSHELKFTTEDFTFTQRLFAILDSESRGRISRQNVKEFVSLRCPVFWRRDDDLRKLDLAEEDSSPTFDEIWESVVSCSSKPVAGRSLVSNCELGVEGWMVFCRFIALAQYLEARRRFSSRHLQQTMRQRNGARGSELVMVDVPPPEPPAVLSPLQLSNYEEKSKTSLPLPELDLDHSLLSAHDSTRKRIPRERGTVKISLFGSSASRMYQTSSLSDVEFAIAYYQHNDLCGSGIEQCVVRRSMDDMKWLNDTFASHKALGGTLCGRILPPFPGTGNRALASHFETDSVINSSIKSTGGAIATAAKGVGKIRDAAKSLLGSYLTSPVDGAPSKPTKVSRERPISRAVPDSYYNPNVPLVRARHLERYLNYLLEHPALSTSFPLSTILKASQAGLEAAKKSVEECGRTSQELKAESPDFGDGKQLVTSFLPGTSSTTQNLRWVRTAAQAAMALKVHGMLETTGMNSASARLQHASLPKLSGPRKSGWEDMESDGQRLVEVSDGASSALSGGNNFEEGVVNVSSNLQSEDNFEGEGYDLLPLPVPAPERAILHVGNENNASSLDIEREERFHYGTNKEGEIIGVEYEDQNSVLIGEVSVDDNIDKLREVIGSVDNTLSRCLSSSGGTGKVQRELQSLHLDIVRGLDSWEGMRGQFVSQRALLKGVAGIEQSREIFEESNLAILDDISWQASLANSAVSAAEDVRSAVRVSRTASNAKAAASMAAMTAQQACDKGNFSSVDEARAAQTRASIAQSRAIHAAVVEHEAKTVKRRATLALAHDVRCWNVHRKREMLRSTLQHARSQHEAARRAVDAWSSFRDGFIGSAVFPSAQEAPQTPAEVPVPVARVDATEFSDNDDDVTATIFDEPSRGASIVAVEHDALNRVKSDDDIEGIPAATMDALTSMISQDVQDNFDLMDPALPFATADPVVEQEAVAVQEADLLGLGNSGNFHDAASGAPDVSNSNMNEPLSASVESLLEGLMTWGGGIDAEEDHFNLPVGMAASIMLEESVAMDSSKIA